MQKLFHTSFLYALLYARDIIVSMIYARAQNIKHAWRDALRRLYDEGRENPLRGFYRCMPAYVCVDDTRGEHYDDLYHLPVSEIAEGNKYLVTGEGDDEMIDDASRQIRERLFGSQGDEESGEEQNQIDRIVEYLQKNPEGRNATASLWRLEDMWSDSVPHIQTISFSLADGELEANVHARETDGYRRLLPDLSRYATLQHHVADRLGVSPGAYAYHTDALHFRENDREHVNLLLAP